MWKELKPVQRVLPSGIITVDKRGKIRFGARDIRQWRLRQYKTLKVLQDTVTPSLIAFQLHIEEIPEGVKLRHMNGTTDCSVAWLARKLKIKAGRYMARKDGGLIIVDFSQRVKLDDIY